MNSPIIALQCVFAMSQTEFVLCNADIGLSVLVPRDLEQRASQSHCESTDTPDLPIPLTSGKKDPPMAIQGSSRTLCNAIQGSVCDLWSCMEHCNGSKGPKQKQKKPPVPKGPGVVVQSPWGLAIEDDCMYQCNQDCNDT